MTCCIFYQIICNQVSNDGFFPPAQLASALCLLINDTISHQPVVEAGRWLLVSGYEKKKVWCDEDIDIDAVKDIDTPAKHAEMDDGKQN